MTKTKEIRIKSENGKVKALYKAGDDFVLTRIDVESANSIITKGEIVQSDRTDFPICVDSKWYFQQEEIKKPRQKADEKNG